MKNYYVGLINGIVLGFKSREDYIDCFNEEPVDVACTMNGRDVHLQSLSGAHVVVAWTEDDDA